MTTSDPTNTPGSSRGLPLKMLGVVLPVLVVTGGVVVAWMLVKTAPKSAPEPPPRLARLVETQSVEFKPQPTLLHVHGTVQPAREVTVYPRVSGEVMEISPALIPGGRFEEGALLVKIDRVDFELAVRQQESDLARAKATLALEMGQQSVAQREFELLGETVPNENRNLVLRQPQLAQARATLDAAEAALDLAKLNLERTTIRAPFNATLRARNVNVGMQVNPNTALATLTGSDEYWVELTVPVDQLRWVRFPDVSQASGSKVHLTSVSSGNGHAVRTGEILRLLPDLEPNGRLARVLVSVQDPRSLLPENAGKPPLILGDYVRAEIQGVGLASAAALERRVFRDGDVVWVMNAEKQLEIRPVTVGFRTVDTMLVTAGLEPGEQVIMTDLPAAVPGMALRTPEDAAREGGGRRPGMQQSGSGVTALDNGEGRRP